MRSIVYALGVGSLVSGLGTGCGTVRGGPLAGAGGPPTTVCNPNDDMSRTACDTSGCLTVPTGVAGACVGSNPQPTGSSGGDESAAGAGGSPGCGGAPCDTPPAVACPSNYQKLEGDGYCSLCKGDAKCGDTCSKCPAGAPKCKDLGTTSQCVACLSDGDCSGATPVCNSTTNVCGPPPSCAGLADTCGPNGDASCCASNLVKGGTFNRSNDENYPATIADFRLDNYEITVGRFRRFVAAYAPDMIPAGAGKNPNNPSDPGWDTAWNGGFPVTSDELTRFQRPEDCGGALNWTSVEGTASTESLPINCLNWFEAEAFCIWDGGRLPTEAEWDYAAAGGIEQRAYPWGSATPDCSYANLQLSPAPTPSYCADGRANIVGSESPKGDGRFGQSDLAGNVWEWTQDFWEPRFPNPCNNCAVFPLQGYGTRVFRGGGYQNGPATLGSSTRTHNVPSFRFRDLGARCARPASSAKADAN